MEEREDSIWSVVPKETEREDQGNVYRTVTRTALVYMDATWALKKAQEKKLELAEMECYDGYVELRSWAR